MDKNLLKISPRKAVVTVVMRRLAAVAVAAVVVLGVASCSGAVERARREVAVEQVVDAARRGSAGAVVTLRIRNDSRRNLRVDDLRVELYLAGGRAAVWQLHEPLNIPRRTSADLRTLWRLRSDDPMAWYALERRIRSGEIASIEVAAEGSVRVAWWKKVKFSSERVPLSDFLNTFGATIDDLEKFLE